MSTENNKKLQFCRQKIQISENDCFIAKLLLNFLYICYIWMISLQKEGIDTLKIICRDIEKSEQKKN